MRPGLELIIFLALLELLLWLRHGPYVAAVQGTAVIAILVTVGLSLRRGLPSGRFLQSRAVAPSRAWLLALAFTGGAAAVLIVAGRWMNWWVGGLHFDFGGLTGWRVSGWWLGKLVVVAAQQLLLQFFLLPRVHELTGRRGPTLVLSSLVFGAMHLPNYLLAGLTAVAAPVWCSMYLRTRRVVPLILSHLILAVVARAACGDAIHHMRVGAAVLPLLPRIVAAADGSELRVAPRAVEGFLDRCSTEGERAICTGWAADLDRRQPATEIVVLAAGSLHRYPATMLPRPDVAAEFHLPAIERCGFRIDLPGVWLTAPEGVRFFATAADGTTTELEYLWP